jgi:hypothetical protein
MAAPPCLGMARPACWAALLLAMRLPWSVRVLGLPLLLPVLLWQAPRPAPGEFELLAADVGQGNAVLVRTASHSLVYDAGPRYGPESDAGHRVLVPLLRALGERLDTLVLSHRDSDHTGGAPAVLAMQPQAALLSSHRGHAPAAGVRRRGAAPPASAGLGRRALRGAAPGDGRLPGFPPNAVSAACCASATAAGGAAGGRHRAAAGAALLARAPARLRAEVLLVPHHGSKTSSSAAFLDAVAAALRAGAGRLPQPLRPPGGAARCWPATRSAAWRWCAPDPLRRGVVVVRGSGRRPLRARRHLALRYWHHSIPSGIESLCVDVEEGRFPIRANYLSVGSRRPLGAGAGSLALLAWMPDAERQAALAVIAPQLQQRYPRITIDLLETRAREARERGYAVLLDVVVERMGGIAAPILGADGRPVAAISIAALNDRITSREADLAKALKRECATCEVLWSGAAHQSALATRTTRTAAAGGRRSPVH